MAPPGVVHLDSIADTAAYEALADHGYASQSASTILSANIGQS
jgi:hypothetical protein